MTGRALDHQQYRFKSEKVTVKAHFRRFRQSSATAPTPHRRPEQAPQPPHAAPVLTPTEVYVGGYGYRLDWPNHLRGKAAAKRKEADELNGKIQRDIALAARCCDEADELERIAAIVELDQRSPLLSDEPPAPDGLAMATDQLFNGVQPGFAATDVRAPMKSTDPDTKHRWSAIFVPKSGEPWGPNEQVMTDAEIEQIAEDAGESASATYEREVPWQEGRRHVTRMDVAWRDGSGFTRFERVDEQPLGATSEAVAAGWGESLPPQDPAAAETLTMPVTGGVR